VGRQNFLAQVSLLTKPGSPLDFGLNLEILFIDLNYLPEVPPPNSVGLSIDIVNI
jgi:hypothetical protein